MIKLNLKQNALHSLYHAIEHLGMVEDYFEPTDRFFDPDSHSLEWKEENGATIFYCGNFVRPPSNYNYKFVILHLIQGLELLVKSYIESKEPDAIFKDKKKKKTISLREGLPKLLSLDPGLLNIQQITLIQQANDIRNTIEHYEFSYATKEARNIALEFLSISNYLAYKFFDINLAEEFSYDPWNNKEDPVGFILEGLFYKIGVAGRDANDNLAILWKQRNDNDTLYLCLQCGTRAASVAKGCCIVCTSPTEEDIGKLLAELEDLSEKYVQLNVLFENN